MKRVLVRFWRRGGREPSAALLVVDVEPSEILWILGEIRRGAAGTLERFLLGDGTVLAVELARRLPERPLGRVSLAGPRDRADAVLDVLSEFREESFQGNTGLR
jgi:hypothetical protein